MDNLYKMTHIGRPVDPRYPTNRAINVIGVLMAVAMFIVRLVAGDDLVLAVILAVLSSVTVFYTWAFAREIDPQEDLSAFIAVILVIIALFALNAIFNIGVLFLTMSMIRIVNRTVGLPPKLTDSLILLFFTAVVGFWGSWVFASMGVIAFFMDAMLPPQNRRSQLFGLIAAVIMIAAFVMQGEQQIPVLPTFEFVIGILVVTVTFIPLIMKTGQVEVMCDTSDERLLPIRVQAGQVFALLFGFIMAFWKGNTGIILFLPLWLTIAGVSLFPLVKPFLPDWDLSPRG